MSTPLSNNSNPWMPVGSKTEWPMKSQNTNGKTVQSLGVEWTNSWNTTPNNTNLKQKALPQVNRLKLYLQKRQLNIIDRKQY